jgi:uncharacterized protein YjbJ (UPF0337 family)
MASNNPTNDKQASILGGHIQYAKGVVEETVGPLSPSSPPSAPLLTIQIGKATASHPWQKSGKQDTAAGMQEMKKANAQNTSEPAQSGVVGKVEEAVGKAAGCEGMEKEGRKRQGNA